MFIGVMQTVVDESSQSVGNPKVLAVLFIEEDIPYGLLLSQISTH